MRTIYILIHFQLILTTCFSQSTYLPLVEENKYWIMKTYNDNEPAPQAISGFMNTFEGDTILNGVKYKKLYMYNLAGKHPCQFPPCFVFDLPYQLLDRYLYAFFREDTATKKIYYLPHKQNISGYEICDSSECLIFDFALNKGDTLNDYIQQIINRYNTNYIFFKVDSILYGSSEIEHAQITRKITITHGDYPYNEFRVFEGIGFESGLLDNIVSRAHLNNYCEGSFEDCNIVTSNYNKYIYNNIEVYPNPTNEFINIKIQNPINKIEILNLDGRKKDIKNSSTRINVGDLINGLKVLKLIDNKGKIYITKFLKI